MGKRMIMSLALLAATTAVYGQKRSVSGIVTDESGAVLSGATVRVKGGNGGTHTDENGRFVLSGVSDTDRLVISYIGMKPQTLEPQATMTVVLVTDDQNLDEAIVVAFGEQKKSSFTGSAGVINSKALEQRQLTNVMDALQGNVAGLQAYSHSGAPDANPEFRIRGSFPPAFAFPPFGLPPSVPAMSSSGASGAVPAPFPCAVSALCVSLVKALYHQLVVSVLPRGGAGGAILQGKICGVTE